jgi:hypothetical protein
MFHKELDRAEAGDNMGALLRGVKREQIRRGQTIVAVGSMKAIKRFHAQIYVLTKDEGGRYNPFMINYTPQVYLRTADITTKFAWPSGDPADAEKMVGCGSHQEDIHTDVLYRSCRVTTSSSSASCTTTSRPTSVLASLSVRGTRPVSSGCQTCLPLLTAFCSRHGHHHQDP